MARKRPPNIELVLHGSEHIRCDACQDFIVNDDAVIHTYTAKEFGGNGLFITHTGPCEKEVKRV